MKTIEGWNVSAVDDARFCQADALSEVRQESRRRCLVRLVFVIYWLLIFGGVLRKWGLPQLQAPLFFIRVPFTLWLYGLALARGCWPRTHGPLLAAYVLAVAAAALVPIQLVAGGYDARYLLIAGYGWMNYFFYIPLAFIVGAQFRRQDVLRLLRYTLWLAILAAPLVALQFVSSPNSVFNQGAGIDAGVQVHTLGAALGYIRPTGFFTSSLAQALFLATAATAVLYGWIQSSRHEVAGRATLVMATAATLSMLAFSGSRTAMFMVGIVFVTTMISGIATRKRRLMLRAGVWPLALVILLVLLWPLVFPEAYSVFLTRWNGAYAVEAHQFMFGPFGRALYPLYAWIQYMGGPLFGYLLGLGGNAATRLSWVHFPQAAYNWSGYGGWGTESGWGVHLVELGIPLGLAYSAFRVWLTGWFLTKAWRGMKRQRDPLPLMLFGFSGVLLLLGQITVQGDVGGYAWLFLGVCLAAAKSANLP
jgi:hypothetical protein